MLKKTKKLGLALSCLSLAVCAGMGFGTMDKMQAAAENDYLTINTGASIRMNTNKDETTGEVTGYDTGIRFTATASEELVSQLVETTGETVSYKAGAELGMFIVPQSYIAAYNAQAEDLKIADYFDYFHEVKGLEKSKFTYVCNADELNTTGSTQYNVSIVELLEENYNRSYQAVAYYALNDANGEQVYYYTGTSDARTVSYVANAALLDAEKTYSATQRAALGNIIERAIQLKFNANVEGEETEYTVALHGDKTVDLKSYFANEITDPALAMSVTEGSEAVKLEGNVASATQFGETAKVNITAYGGDVNFNVTVRTIEKDKTEVIDFAGMNDLDTAKTATKDSTITYLDTFEDATGVAKMTATKSWGHFGFQPVYDMTTYADSYYIVFRMYIKNGFAGTLWFGGGNNCLTTVETGKWVDYYFPAQVFKKNWATCTTNYVVGNMALVASTACEMYIDEIYTVSNVAVAENEINSFSDQTQTHSVVASGSTITYQDSFEGATGVIKATATGTWGGIGIKPLQDMSAYANSAYVVMRMYVVNSGVLWFGGGNNCLTTIETGKWVDYYFPAQVFTKNWANWTTSYTLGNMAITNSKAFEIYIDGIYTVGNVASNEVNSFSDQTKMHSVVASGSTITYQDSFEGATGVIKATATGTWGGIGIKPLQDMSAYANSAYVVMRMYVVNSGVLWFGGGNNCLTTIETGKWVDYYFPAQVFKKNWANWTTSYTLGNMALTNSKAFELYVDEIYVASTAPKGNKVITFDDATQIQSTAKNGASNITWAAEYAGATGVAQMKTSGSWGYFGIKPMQDMSVYANCKYIVFRMYFVDSADVVLWFGGANNCLNPGDIKVGQWVDCYFPGEKFTTNWATWTTEYKIDSMVLSFNKNVGTVYVDEIFVTNTMPA